MIRLEEITPENWRYDLKVAESQKNYVSDSMRLLARAYAYRNYNSVALVIYNDDTPVGMALYHDIEEAYDFSQLFIDENYQHRPCCFFYQKLGSVPRPYKHSYGRG